MESRCGLLCSECDFLKQSGCKGCIESDGHPFHGDCKIALCCIKSGYEHCGECVNFPCKELNDFAFDPVHGDENGSRLETLHLWAKN